ncbi:hypothetical protein JTE90_004062 [Oedothorax gibbosus]|uniref:C2H2-type domain-containing protein n=1 Tax=Oedothorax gibbosus TaxID=931172 RepID=A0AAV6U531_9ARAC|nr:hypothetical protein JTE90_004062 [Oedothorax gibbosus]
MMTASDKCASLVTPPLPASPSPTVFLTPHTHRYPSPNPVPVLVSPTSSPGPLGLTDEQAPRTRSPSAPSPSPTRCIPTVFHAENTFPPSLTNPSSSLPLDPSWSLTFSPSLSQKATFPRAKSPSLTQRPETSPVTVQDSTPTVATTHLPEPPPPSISLEETTNGTAELPPEPSMSTSSSSSIVERTVELQPLPPSPNPATDVIDLTGSPKTRPHPPLIEEDWTCGFCEVHFSSRMECDAHLSDIHLLSQEKVELSPPRDAKHEELPKSPALRDSPLVPTLVEPDNAQFNIFNTPLPPKSKLFRCQSCGLQFDQYQRFRTHKLTHQKTPFPSFPSPMTTTATTHAEPPTSASIFTTRGDTAPLARPSKPASDATKSSAIILPPPTMMSL